MLSEVLSNILPQSIINISNTYYDPELLIKIKYDFTDDSKRVYAGILNTSELNEIKRGSALMGDLVDIDGYEITGPLDDIIVIDDIKQIQDFKSLDILDKTKNGRYEISTFTDFVGELLKHTRQAYLDRGLVIPDDVVVSDKTRKIIDAIRYFVDLLTEGYNSDNKQNYDWYEDTIDKMQFTSDRNFEKTISDFLSLREPPPTFVNGINGEKILEAYDNVINIIKNDFI